MSKKNCWEVMNCGRQTGGTKVSEMGVCPAAIEALSMERMRARTADALAG